MPNAEDMVHGDLESRGFECRVFSKQELRGGKTPDRRVFRDGDFAFFLEVKEIAYDQWAGGSRADPIFNRLSDDIHQAVKQFDAVNADRQQPNVLALVNNDPGCRWLDLIGVVTGCLMLKNGRLAPIYMKYSQGRIKNDCHKVHLYLWYEQRKKTRWLFNTVDSCHLGRLCELFGVNPASISAV